MGKAPKSRKSRTAQRTNRRSSAAPAKLKSPRTATRRQKSTAGESSGPYGTILPIFPLPVSVNQRLPSGPAVIPVGFDNEPNSVIAPAVVILPIFPSPAKLSPSSANQRLPSGPSVIPKGDDVDGKLNSVITPPVVILVIPGFCSVNQRLPSGPAVMLTAAS